MDTKLTKYKNMENIRSDNALNLVGGDEVHVVHVQVEDILGEPEGPKTGA